MSTRTPSGDLPVRRVDRILAFMSLGMLALSVVCFLSIIIGTAVGMQQADFGGGVWPAVSLVVWLAPILAFLLLLTVLVMSFVRRARANRGD